MTAALKRSLAALHTLRLFQWCSHAACAVGISGSLRFRPLAAVLLRPRGRGGQVKSYKRTFTGPSCRAVRDPELSFLGQVSGHDLLCQAFGPLGASMEQGELLLLTERDHCSGSLHTPGYVWGDPGKVKSRGLSAQLAAVAALGLHGCLTDRELSQPAHMEAEPPGLRRFRQES
jgi:hypothetical protein